MPPIVFAALTFGGALLGGRPSSLRFFDASIASWLRASSLCASCRADFLLGLHLASASSTSSATLLFDGVHDVPDVGHQLAAADQADVEVAVVALDGDVEP